MPLGWRWFLQPLFCKDWTGFPYRPRIDSSWLSEGRGFENRCGYRSRDNRCRHGRVRDNDS